MTLGERLKAAREKRELDLADVAAAIGWSESHLYFCERGKRGLSVELLNAWCDLLGLNFRQMLLLKEKEQEAKIEQRRARKMAIRIKLAEKQEGKKPSGEAGT